MTESDITGALRGHLTLSFPQGEWTKHADRFTSGIPDASFGWNGNTSWLEFKLLGPTQTVHDELRADQLDKLVKLERATHHAWVVCWVKAHRTGATAHTLVYRPSMLRHGNVPRTEEHADVAWPFAAVRLWDHGVILLDKFSHVGVAELIRATHQ